ncbi:MAG: hypothetical protein LBT26_04160 [Clostridiales Family XIII bacterium]|jgi:hypothetical protein|nr:hypothetical protein [Clostridiales Family XIII bacterium]
MFRYSQGYEIDGSDTSYNLVLPETEKCLEVARFLLGLKTVHRGAPLAIQNASAMREVLTATSRPAPILTGYTRIAALTGKQYAHEDIDALFADLLANGAASCGIGFAYVHPYLLYPEIKGEIIECLRELSGDRHVFEQPEFPSMYYADHFGFLGLFLDPVNAEQHYSAQWEDSAAVLPRAGTPYRLLEIGISLGHWTPRHYYELTKLAAAYPEFEIDAFATLSASLWEAELDKKQWLRRYVWERIDVAAADPAGLIRRLAHAEGFLFSKNWWLRRQKCKRQGADMAQTGARELLDLQNTSSFAGYDASKLQEEERQPELAILKGIFGNEIDLTIDEYAAAAGKLAGVRFFSDLQFEEWTMLQFEFSMNGEKVCGMMRFAREAGSTGGGTRLVFSLPYTAKDYFRRVFGV